MSKLFFSILSISIAGFFIFLLLKILEKLLYLNRKKAVYVLMKLIVLFYLITPILILLSYIFKSYKKYYLIQGEDFISGIKMDKAFLYQFYVENGFPTMLSSIFIVWLIGFVALYLFYIIRYHYNLKLLFKVSKINLDTNINNIILQFRKEFGISKEFSVYTSNIISSPFIAGISHPTIFLPELNFSNREIKFIIKHELVHYKNHDMIFQQLLVYIKCFYWINPLLYFFMKSFYDSCEITCDEICLDNSTRNTQLAYINTILMFTNLPNKTNSFVGFYSSSIIERRIQSIMKLQKHQKNISTIILSTVIIFMFPVISYAATQSTSLMQSVLGKALENENKHLEEFNLPEGIDIYEEQSNVVRATKQSYQNLEIVPYGTNFIDCNLNNERLIIESLELSKDTKVQFFLTGYNETDKFSAGIIDNSTKKYVNSVNGVINYTFTIPKDGTYDLFIDSDYNVDISGTINIK